MKTPTKAAILGIAAALLFGLSACSGDDTTPTNTTTTTSDAGNVPAPDDPDAAGFEEFPIGDPLSLFPLEVAAVYFQPVDMTPAGMGLSAAESDMHIEADISAAAGNELGYGVGDFVPGLTVDYTITNTANNEVAAAGTFMPMNASDGPHYGANIALPNAGVYLVRFSIKSPEHTGTVLHTDPETGVTGRFWSEPIVAEWEFNYVPREW
ncbi:MAG: iron transporter [Propionibacteriaceae bacterium]|jgi:uncharacterized protein involved in high-affinity Fe2+ transport|nr:iron transporter [Propionibacteriaceae bacterium]